MSEKVITLKSGKQVTVSETTSQYSRHFKSSVPLTMEEGIEAQHLLGYHTAGYGFESFRSSKVCANWNCSRSCD